MPRHPTTKAPAHGELRLHAAEMLVPEGTGIATPRPGRRVALWPGVTAAALALVAGWLLLSWQKGMLQGAPAPVSRVAFRSAATDLSVIFETDVMPLSPEDAVKLNDERPIDVADVQPARPFSVQVGNENKDRFQEAVRCLAQAIYYEAAGEPEEGQRAVAQIVLNRLRHPAFPQTVCGVVYQGSERVTGCQFTFTCDGSLARRPVPSVFARAERYAREALGGRVAASVGTAVNYHADYVVPYWAASLQKVAKIGTHIFYGLRGALGDRSAFRARYDLNAEGTVPLVAPSPTTPDLANPLGALPGAAPPARQPSLAEDLRSGRLLQDGADQGLAPNSERVLEADRARGELAVGGSRLKDQAEKESQPAATPSPPKD